MIEVFKTNVNDVDQAKMLIDQIHETFSYEANFDLQDCDRILRVKCKTGVVHASALIRLLHDVGFQAEVLPDSHPTGNILSKNVDRYLKINN